MKKEAIERVISVCVIICPECNRMQDAEVTQYGVMPFATYIHKCEHCGYLIMESEWDEVSSHTWTESLPKP